MQFDIVVAVDNKFGIGRNNTLPWKLSDDLRYFRSLTSAAAEKQRNAVIMGRRTYDALPTKARPLIDRLNIILSWTPLTVPDGVLTATSLDHALAVAQSQCVHRCFVIGGGQIYKEALEHPALRLVYITRIDGDFSCDTFFPQEPKLALVAACGPREEDGVSFRYEQWKRD